MKMSSFEQTQWQILRLLRENPGKFHSGTALASRLRITRTGIWKHVKALRALGYEIESHCKEGYRLTVLPDILVPEEVRHGLDTAWLGREYHFLPQVGSTNDYALDLARRKAAHGCVVVAEEQTSGRGRLRRPWVSPPGCGLYLSILLRSAIPVREASQTNLVAALAMTALLRDRYALPATIKWPNDLLIGGKKIVGILTEMQSDQDFTSFLVLGMGVNVNHGTEDLPGPFRYPVTSLALELNGRVRRLDLLLEFLNRFEAIYDRFLAEGFGSLAPQVEACSGILGREVLIQTGKGEVAGKAVGLTPEGALRLLTREGREETIWVGDVTRVEGLA